MAVKTQAYSLWIARIAASSRLRICPRIRCTGSWPRYAGSVTSREVNAAPLIVLYRRF
jgi:hypothetical protein